MATFLTQLCADQLVLPITRDPAAIEPLITQLRSSGVVGEVRIIDEMSGAIVTRFPLDEEPEEGDFCQPLPAA